MNVTLLSHRDTQIHSVVYAGRAHNLAVRSCGKDPAREMIWRAGQISGRV